MYHNITQYTIIIYHDLPYYTIIYHNLPYYTILYHILPGYTILYHFIPSYTLKPKLNSRYPRKKNGSFLHKYKKSHSIDPGNPEYHKNKSIYDKLRLAELLGLALPQSHSRQSLKHVEGFPTLGGYIGICRV